MSNLNTAVHALLSDNEAFKFVAVHFPGSTKTYHYKTMLDLAVDDEVIVMTHGDNMKVVLVVDVIDYCDFDEESFKYGWIVSKVDTTEYNKMLDMEAEVLKILKSEQRKHIRKQAIEAINCSLDDKTVQKIKTLSRL